MIVKSFLHVEEPDSKGLWEDPKVLKLGVEVPIWEPENKGLAYLGDAITRLAGLAF